MSLTSIRGRAWRYGDNVNTDVMFPGKYTYTLRDPAEIAAHALEDLDPTFAREVRPGDIVVAGANLGCGSSREQAALCLKYAGVAAVVAASFARLFFRNAINAGLPAISCPDAVPFIAKGDEVALDLGAGVLEVRGRSFPFPPLPAEVLGILEDGGLIPHLRKTLQGGS